MTTSITTTNTQISVASDYNAGFVSAAKDLGGKWRAPCWVFDIRDEDRVRALCVKYYGTDGRVADLVTLKIEWKKDSSAQQEAIAVNGRTIARAYGRDSGAKMGDGIVLLVGGFGSGGSVKNWTTRVRGGTVVLVRDFPKSAAELLVKTESETRIYSIEAEAAPVDRDALSEERARLLARLGEINQILGSE
jgi:hypothetical protein